jgi:hypothetical protein
MNRHISYYFTRKFVYVSILGWLIFLLSACGGAGSGTNSSGTSSVKITGPVGKVKLFTLASTVGSPD